MTAEPKNAPLPPRLTRMAASAIRSEARIVSSPPLGGRYTTEETILYNITLMAAAGRQIKDCSALEIGCSSWVTLRPLIELGIDYFGVDIRKSNIEKSRQFFGSSLPSNVRYDVRAGQDVTPERDGMFDIVFVLGLIYHLDIRDTYQILDSARRMRLGGVAVDSPVWPSERTKVHYYQVDGNIYSGYTTHELEDLSPAEMETMGHASYGSTQYPSFHFDQKCLRRFLNNLGFPAVTEYSCNHNAQNFWGKPFELMFNTMDWPIMFCPGSYHDGEKATPGIFQDIPERGPDRSVAPADLTFVLDRLRSHFIEIAAQREVTPLDVDRAAEMLPIRLLPHMLLTMIDAGLPFGLLMHSIRRYLIAPVRHGSSHDRAHGLMVLLSMAKRHGPSEPVWVADLCRGFFEIFFYAYRGEHGRADPMDQMMSAWSVEPAPPILDLLPQSSLAWANALWRLPVETIIGDVVTQLPLETAENTTAYRDGSIRPTDPDTTSRPHRSQVPDSRAP
jgi:hypothetical protein